MLSGFYVTISVLLLPSGRGVLCWHPWLYVGELRESCTCYLKLEQEPLFPPSALSLWTSNFFYNLKMCICLPSYKQWVEECAGTWKRQWTISLCLALSLPTAVILNQGICFFFFVVTFILYLAFIKILELAFIVNIYVENTVINQHLLGSKEACEMVQFLFEEVTEAYTGVLLWIPRLYFGPRKGKLS